MDKYSILIPIHNEVNSIPILLDALKYYSNEGHEIIIIDDGSNDGSSDILENSKIINLVSLDRNEGKGYAIRQGLKKVMNDKVLIFDGDMEIDPSGISKLMILDTKNNINCVMGYRFKSLSPLKSNFDWGNFMFTSFFNIIFNKNHKDVLCCAKAFYLDMIKSHNLRSNGFDIDVELTSLISIIFNLKPIPQIAINYNRRTIQEGKKLKVSDGWSILSRIIKMIKYLL